MTVLRLLESIHGHLGVLAAAALLHPAILLRRGRPLSRGLRWSIGLTTAVVALAFATGLTIYDGYREHVRPQLLLEHYDTALLFETKEHLAWAVLTLALGAGMAALAAPRDAKRIRQAAAAFYSVAALLCLVTASLGTWIAAVSGFPQ